MIVDANDKSPWALPLSGIVGPKRLTPDSRGNRALAGRRTQPKLRAPESVPQVSSGRVTWATDPEAVAPQRGQRGATIPRDSSSPGLCLVATGGNPGNGAGGRSRVDGYTPSSSVTPWSIPRQPQAAL